MLYIVHVTRECYRVTAIVASDERDGDDNMVDDNKRDGNDKSNRDGRRDGNNERGDHDGGALGDGEWLPQCTLPRSPTHPGRLMRRCPVLSIDWKTQKMVF